MIGMTFSSFLTLLIIGVVCALISHKLVASRSSHDRVNYLTQLIVGWIGAWLGSPVLGHWGRMVPNTDIYLVPAVLGALASIYMLIRLVKTARSLMAPMASDETPRSEQSRVA